MLTPDHVLPLLKGVVKSGEGWKALCPFHDDDKPSLSIKEGSDGRVLLHCFTGCSFTQILSALGLKLPKQGSGGFLATYDYVDQDGKLLFQVCRTVDKKFFQRRKDEYGDIIWGLAAGFYQKNKSGNWVRISPKEAKDNPAAKEFPECEKHLYRLPDILHGIADQQTVFLVEGEKDADRLASAGLIATCNPGGATGGKPGEKWISKYTNVLVKAKEVIVIPDNDDVGKEFALRVSRIICKAGGNSKILSLPSLPPKGDVSDWLKSPDNSVTDLTELAAFASKPPLPKVNSASDIPLLMTEMIEKGDWLLAMELCFSTEAMDALASIEIPELAVLRSQIKQLLPKKINLKDLNAAISVARKRIKKKSVQADLASDPIGAFFEATDSGAQRFVPSKLGRWIAQSGDYLFVAGKLKVYKDGYYQDDAGRVEKLIVEALGESWDMYHCRQVITWMKQQFFIDAKSLPVNHGLLCLKNGVYDIKTSKLYKHNKKYRFLVQHPIKYDPDAKSDSLDKFVNDVFESSCIPVIWEFAGYCLLPQSVEMKKLIILTGRRNNGKSTWLSFLEKCLGEENCSHESLQSLAEDKYSVAELFGKVANIVSDLDASLVRRTDVIKQLTGGDTVRGERKYQDPFYFQNRARMIFSANELPSISDYNEAFFDRLLIVHCPNIFELGKNADPSLAAKLNTEQCKSAWLNGALQGAVRLLQNRCFSQSPDIEAMIGAYMRECDSVTEFIHECCIREAEGFTPKRELYKAYTDWCRPNNRPAVSSIRFSKRVQQRPNNLTTTRRFVAADSKQVWSWLGVRLSGNITLIRQEAQEHWYDKI